MEYYPALGGGEIPRQAKTQMSVEDILNEINSHRRHRLYHCTSIKQPNPDKNEARD